MLCKSGCLQLQIAGAGFVRNHYEPEATTTKLLAHIYGVGSSQASVIQCEEQSKVSDSFRDMHCG